MTWMEFLQTSVILPTANSTNNRRTFWRIQFGLRPQQCKSNNPQTHQKPSQSKKNPQSLNNPIKDLRRHVAAVASSPATKTHDTSVSDAELQHARSVFSAVATPPPTRGDRSAQIVGVRRHQHAPKTRRSPSWIKAFYARYLCTRIKEKRVALWKKNDRWTGWGVRAVELRWSKVCCLFIFVQKGGGRLEEVN